MFFSGSQIAVERVKGAACSRLSTQVFTCSIGRHSRIPQTALPSKLRSLRKISTAKVVGVSLCTWELRHSRRCQLLPPPHLGGQTSFISDSLRYLISPKLKQMKKHPKHQFLAVGQRYTNGIISIQYQKRRVEILKSGTSV